MNWTNSELFRPISDRIELNRPVSSQIEIGGKKKKDLPWKRVQLRQQPHGVSMCVGCGCAIPGGAPMLFQNNTYSRNTFSNLKFTSVIDFSSRYLKKFDLGVVSYIPIGGAILISRH